MLVQHIRSRSVEGGEIPAIALTAHARDISQQEAFDSGFHVYITKPVEPEALVRAIASFIEHHTHSYKRKITAIAIQLELSKLHLKRNSRQPLRLQR